MTLTLAACAAVTTGLVLHRVFFPPRSAAAQFVVAPRFIPDWITKVDKGIRLGPTAAPVQLIEFADFECPACADFQRKLTVLRKRYPVQVSLIYMHFPLPGHRFAIPAARAAECAGVQARFEEMADQLYEGQETFGLKPWSDYAAAANVPDLAAFSRCVETSDPVPRVEQDKELGQTIDIKGTPTILFNGWMIAPPPSAGDLDAMVQAVLAGKSPMPLEHERR